jgi:hypothetical protein
VEELAAGEQALEIRALVFHKRFAYCPTAHHFSR